MNIDLQWCAYIAVERGILTPELCCQIRDMFDGECDLQTFAQTILENGLCEDAELVQAMMNEAYTHALDTNPPPANHFDDTAEPGLSPSSPASKSKPTSGPPTVSMLAAPPVSADTGTAPKPQTVSLVDSSAPPSPVVSPGDSPAPAAAPAPSPAAPSGLSLKSAPPPTEPAVPPGITPPAPSAPPVTVTASILAAGEIPTIEGAEGLSEEDQRQLMVDFLICMRNMEASDFHLSADACPFARINLKIRKLGETILSADASKKLNTVFLSDEQKIEFDKTRDLDYCLALDESNRFRVNLLVHKEGIAGTYRLIPNRVKTLEELGYPSPESIYKLLDFHNGLILVTGAIGSGKTTTLAALVNRMNQKRFDHIITVEDPIEIVQMSQNCNVTQREVGRHTVSYATALKGALRQDPDIIVIGELRDLETIEMAITASETGHLVIGTLHTNDAATTLNRLLDVFPPTQQPQIRAMVAESLKGIICQQLIPNIDGHMVVALEILLNNTAVANNIRENKTHQLKQVLETGTKQGMCTMDWSIYALYERGLLSEKLTISKLKDKAFINRIKNKQLTQSSEEEQGAASEPKKKRFGFR